jgi:hypothetical protein
MTTISIPGGLFGFPELTEFRVEGDKLKSTQDAVMIFNVAERGGELFILTVGMYSVAVNTMAPIVQRKDGTWEQVLRREGNAKAKLGWAD